MSAYHTDNEQDDGQALLSLLDGVKQGGTVLSLSDQAQDALRTKLELMHYLLVRDEIRWN